jgi:hypothetical protein
MQVSVPDVEDEATCGQPDCGGAERRLEGDAVSERAREPAAAAASAHTAIR